MKKINLFSVAMVMMFTMSATSCRHLYYQVYNTKAVDEKQLTDTKNYSYETEDFTISYAFWDEYGNPGFEIVNKSDEYINIDLRQSFFIRNGYAYDFSQEKNKLYLEETSIQPYMTIPPHTKKIFTRFEINKEIYKNCALDVKPRKSESLSYTQEDSPLTFGNIIHIQVGEKSPEIVSHAFYVNRITNYRGKHFNLKSTGLKRPVEGTTPIILNPIEVETFEKACKKGVKANDGSVSVPSSCFYTPYYL